jgi:hypothetical protein
LNGRVWPMMMVMISIAMMVLLKYGLIQIIVIKWKNWTLTHHLRHHHRSLYSYIGRPYNRNI